MEAIFVSGSFFKAFRSARSVFLLYLAAADTIGVAQFLGVPSLVAFSISR
jgi:hypothetical protein